MIKAMVVDDQMLLKETLLFMLNQDEEIEAVDGGNNGYEAIELCNKIIPDIILMDLRMPKLDGLAATKKIKQQYSKIKVIILTTFEDEESIFNAMEGGADGYIVKDIKPDALIQAVKSVYLDLYVMHKSVLKSVRQGVIRTTTEKQATLDVVENCGLTKKELSIIKLVVDGKSNKEIAAIMNFSEGTIKNKISGLLSKLDLKDRTQIVVFAIKNNLS